MRYTFPFPLRFLLAAEPQALTAVLAVVQRAISTFMIRQSGLTVACGARSGAVTLIQRFGSAPVHEPQYPPAHPHRFRGISSLHMLFLDGAYRFRGNRATFHRTRQPDHVELARLLDTLSRRIVRVLERGGLLIVDPVHPRLDFEPGSSLDHHAGRFHRLAHRHRPPRRAQGPDPIQRATTG